MINVRVERKLNKQISSFTMSGHANAGPYGYDLVCAGASAVSFGAVNAIDALCHVQLDVEMEDDGGFLRCIIPSHLDSDTHEKVQLLLDGMIVSLQSIAEQYSEHIKVIETTGGE
ncbi:ribosomal-processing cysteine protease Prp [Desertibacillus haloalkaliphilus]|uniref:ribosomal-processing cysteine protease Prp n=1 Tax=Desertibacillus haloalkaliphilus TaxID=1328930 RepID=UPI001C26E311|nr:ribosomal-processing cysteine protease Prp [Desertibacillus haloalkaliphilus]MBU8905023.1 ribosomal-processing cysteine protease Prp [Desertibacillus haloalkaliphilus]